MTKPQIALMQITAALKAGVAPGVVLMDASYGTNAGLRLPRSASPMRAPLCRPSKCAPLPKSA
jgi:hypothetical protein